MTNIILVTGAAGYIGSHTCVELLQAGYEVVALDNLSNSSLESLERVKRLTGQDLPFHKIDVRDKNALDQVFVRYPIAAVVHFAGLKAVGESVEKPLRYFDNNVTGSVSLFQAMLEAGVRKLVFS